jgi:hypothetical protein
LICNCCSEPRNQSGGLADGDEVRAPLPVIRETLYDNSMLFGYVLLFVISIFSILV